MVCFSCSHLVHDPSTRLYNQSSLCCVTLVCCWWMIPSMLLDCWGLLVRELWFSFFLYTVYMHHVLYFLWGCDELFERKLAATGSLFLSEGGCGEKGEYSAGDLWPRGRLISAVTSPDVRLAVSPSQAIAFAHTQTHTCATIRFNTQIHIHWDAHCSVPQAFPDSPPELLHVKL